MKLLDKNPIGSLFGLALNHFVVQHNQIQYCHRTLSSTAPATSTSFNQNMQNFQAENEKILVRDECQKYQVQRYCPHAGADLTHAKIQDSKLICPRHHWAFDLRSQGKCVSGGNITLKVYDSTESLENILQGVKDSLI
jgi:nitrite reductase/ring-hydroxylating ferredoxin subunit